MRYHYAQKQIYTQFFKIGIFKMSKIEFPFYFFEQKINILIYIVKQLKETLGLPKIMVGQHIATHISSKYV
jgi:hypothetical protein